MQPVDEFQPILSALDQAVTTTGAHLVQLAEASPVLLVFLRHSGCPFCREALSDIARARQSIESSGTKIVLVHMADSAAIDCRLRKYSLQNVERICDAEQSLYRAFGLKRGNAWQLLGPKVVVRGFHAAFFSRHGLGRFTADVAQMPGVFMLDRSGIVRRFRHRSAADRPDYAALAAGRAA